MHYVSKIEIFREMYNLGCNYYETDQEFSDNADNLFGEVSDNYREEYGNDFEFEFAIGDKFLCEWFDWVRLQT